MSTPAQIEGSVRWLTERIRDSYNNPRVAVRYAEHLARMLHHAAVEQDRQDFGLGVQRDGKPYVVLPGRHDPPQPLLPIIFAATFGVILAAMVIITYHLL
jgi:hypothetical protein